jgi:hypothetical protein
MRTSLIIVAFMFCLLPLAAHANDQCGMVGIQTGYPSTANQIEAYTICIPYLDSVVNNCDIYTTATSSDNIVCAVYDSDGAGGSPGTLLCDNTTGAPAVSAGFVVIPLTGCGTLSAHHTYYIVKNSTGVQDYEHTTTSGTSYYYSKACCTFDATFNVGATSFTNQDTGYLDLTTIQPFTQKCGISTLGGGASEGYPNYEYASPICTPVATAMVSDCVFYISYVTSSSTQVVCALYDSDGLGGIPGTLLCSNTTGINPLPFVWNGMSLTGCGTLTAGHNYWIVLNDTEAVQYDATASGTQYYYGKACCTFDATYNPAAIPVPSISVSAFIDLVTTPPPAARKRSFITAK